MAHHGSGNGYPWDDAGHHSVPPLTHRISSISEISSPGTPSLGDASYRYSMVSLLTPIERPESPSNEDIDVSHVRLSSAGDSSVASPAEGLSKRMSAVLPGSLRIGTPASPTPRGFGPFSRQSSKTYEPISPAEGSVRRSSLSRAGSKRFSSKKRVSIVADHSIPEEEIDMGLLRSAAPFSSHKTAYTSLAEDNDEPHALSPMRAGFDLSSFTGPMSPQSEAQLQELHRQEAQGILTGGLGAGIRPDTTLKSGELFATMSTTSPPTDTVSRRLSRAMSRRASPRNPGLGRAATIRDLGQSEANKRGEIIEVILEDAPVDISSFEGGNTSQSNFDIDDSSKRKSTFRSTNVEIFYPQANWKPFSMRWPYLVTLIVSSIVLAVVQEYLYQKSTKAPLYSFTKSSSLKTWDYFSFKYLPTLIAVAFGVLWQITDFEVKRLEAYYQLSKDGGALAAESINVDYITFFNFLRPIRALQFKHYAVAVSSIATLLAVSLVPTLQSASFVLFPDRAAREAHPLDEKEIRISGPFSRCLSVVLIIVAGFGCLLLWQLQRRRSGLVADVKGIAGVAAMANRSHILMDFRDMDTATPEIIHQKLKSHRYTLRNSSLAPDDQVPLTQPEKDKYDQHQRTENPHPLMLRPIAGIPFILGMLAFLALIPIVLFTEANIITDKAPWFVTGLAVGIKLAWGTLETDVRMIEPFYILSKRHASPKTLTLDYSSMPFAWMPIRAFLNGHFLVGLVGLGSVLAEVLTVCAISFSGVTGLDFTNKPPPYTPGQGAPSNAHDASEETLHSFWFSFALAVCILTFLCLIAAFVYSRRRHPFLPRQPNTIASILAFIHQSKMLYDFVGTEKMSNDEMVKHLVGIGKTYGLGWFMGRDGETHCGIDEEELVSSYKHGDDARKARLSSYVNWQDY